MKQFEAGFLIGAATAAHQVEGNNLHSDFWAQEHMKNTGFLEPSMDAVDHFNRYKEDIAMMADAGLNAYRFSIEWARIEPEQGRFDDAAVAYYRDMIACCKEHGVEPIMIETPSSVFVADALAKEVDFFSVGSNDLTQYTLACDRQANDLGKFFDPHHPAVLRALKMATDAAHAAGIWIGICGELGADLTLLETFLAIGIGELSVTPASVLPLRAEIRKSIAKTCTLDLLEC